MELRHIEYGKLSISPLNMRYGTEPDVSDILPTIRRRGIFMPLLVRQNGSLDTFEVVAGARRYTAAGVIVAEVGEIEPLPCAVMQEGDDAAALEASLIENIARLDPDEMTQHETFVRLIGRGKSVAEIADTFGYTSRMVEQRLALGNLIPGIRDLYRAEDIDAATVRHLTLATPKQQKAWLKLYNGPEEAPTGSWLKHWLFGGDVPTGNALFPLEVYKGRIVADLFGEESYFSDGGKFWELQNQAVAAKREALLADGWAEVEILEAGRYFSSWAYEPAPKEEGGKVFISISDQGEVEIHEGWILREEARRRRLAAERGTREKPVRVVLPEMTKSLANYVDLHRHALVRLALLDAPSGVALRLAVAQIIAGSALWTVEPDPQTARTEAIAASVKAGSADEAFAQKRRVLLAMLGRPEYQHCVVNHHGGADDSVEVFARLLALPDDGVLELLAFVLAESLEAGSSLVEVLGTQLDVEAKGRWTPDDTFFDLIRDRAVANAMVEDVAGKRVAESNVAEKVRTQKTIIRDCLAGTNGRRQVEDWVPRYLQFPCRAYTERGGVPAVTAGARAGQAFSNAREAA